LRPCLLRWAHSRCCKSHTATTGLFMHDCSPAIPHARAHPGRTRLFLSRHQHTPVSYSAYMSQVRPAVPVRVSTLQLHAFSSLHCVSLVVSSFNKCCAIAALSDSAERLRGFEPPTFQLSYKGSSVRRLTPPILIPNQYTKDIDATIAWPPSLLRCIDPNCTHTHTNRDRRSPIV
jgi:hypothetical protein